MNEAVKPNMLKSLSQWLMGRQSQSEEIQGLMDSREEPEKPLSEQEKELISAVLQFEQLNADDVCVPRSDIVCLQITDTFDGVVETFKTCNHSRLPVCGRNLDDILGFVNIKDILPFIGKPKNNFSIEKLMRPCSFVPDSMNINKVLQLMKSSKVQMAIVLDEYGGTAGLVTLKDILEELVGDLEDEHEDETTMMTKIGENTYRLDPRIPVEDLEEELQAEFKSDEYTDFDTIGGLVLQMAGRVPKQGDSFNMGNGYKVKVTSSDGRRIQQLELISLPTKVKKQAS